VSPAPSLWKKFLLKYLNRGKAATRIAIIGNHMLRRPKHATIEVVAPKEEEGGIEQFWLHFSNTRRTSYSTAPTRVIVTSL
jgi:hypothetical protein